MNIIMIMLGGTESCFGVAIPKQYNLIADCQSLIALSTRLLSTILMDVSSPAA